jgi:hypothetical protein
VASAAPGTRKDRLYWGARLAGEMAAAGLLSPHAAMIALEQAGRAAGLPGDEAARRTAESGVRAGMEAVRHG